MSDKDAIKKALEIWPYKNLYEIATAAPPKAPDTRIPAKPVEKDLFSADISEQIVLSEDEKLLGCHIVASPFISYKQRGRDLKFSMRRLGDARDGLLSKEMIKEIEIGKNLFLAPTEKLYRKMKLISRYKRSVSIDHAFCVLFAQHCISADPMVQKTAIEVPVDSRGGAIDCVSYLKNGDRTAWEVTVNCTDNITSHAARLRGKGFSKIIFACRDHHIRKAAKTILDDAGFEPDFYSTIECVLLSDLFEKVKPTQRKDIQ